MEPVPNHQSTPYQTVPSSLRGFSYPFVAFVIPRVTSWIAIFPPWGIFADPFAKNSIPGSDPEPPLLSRRQAGSVATPRSRSPTVVVRSPLALESLAWWKVVANAAGVEGPVRYRLNPAA